LWRRNIGQCYWGGGGGLKRGTIKKGTGILKEKRKDNGKIEKLGIGKTVGGRGWEYGFWTYVHVLYILSVFFVPSLKI
jgi:hypothetical protein